MSEASGIDGAIHMVASRRLTFAAIQAVHSLRAYAIPWLNIFTFYDFNALRVPQKTVRIAKPHAG